MHGGYQPQHVTLPRWCLRQWELGVTTDTSHWMTCMCQMEPALSQVPETTPHRGTGNQKWGMGRPMGTCKPWDWGQTCSCPECDLAQSWGCPISCQAALGVSQPCFPPSIL